MAGILSPKLYHKSEFRGYDIESIQRRSRLPLARLQPEEGTFVRGRFHFFQSAFPELLAELEAPLPQLFILDEIGPLELDGGGFSPYISEVLQLSTTVLLTIREQCLSDAIDRFNLQSSGIVTDYETLPSLLPFR